MKTENDLKHKRAKISPSNEGEGRRKLSEIEPHPNFGPYLNEPPIYA
jgi:hypothetical protein